MLAMRLGPERSRFSLIVCLCYRMVPAVLIKVVGQEAEVCERVKRDLLQGKRDLLQGKRDLLILAYLSGACRAHQSRWPGG